MNNPIVHVIQDFAIAERLRADLLAAGLSQDSVVLSPIGDEAGPGQSNFTVGDSPSAKGGTDYNDVYRPDGDMQGACILRVLTQDRREEELALAIVERHRIAAPHALSKQREP
ncbi:hypothetical protein ABIB38_001220 [Massilia sp. UYP11]|uniref:hypothetical protein n=1 Tax=Massilia sp. UYP11 TaxID=1756385 RepID=UPI003D1F0C40